MTNLGELPRDPGEEAEKEWSMLMASLLQTPSPAPTSRGLSHGQKKGAVTCLLDVLTPTVIVEMPLNHLPRETPLLSLGVLSNPNTVIH